VSAGTRRDEEEKRGGKNGEPVKHGIRWSVWL
jgi:hypothetical protein